MILIVALVCQANFARAEIFGGIDFPQGASSFADRVIRYDPLFGGGPAPTRPTSLPEYALAPPEGATAARDVSLGRGGLLEVRFLDNSLTNSGDSVPDLHIFEIGPDVEDTFIAIRPDGATAASISASCLDQRAPFADGFCEVGKVFGSTSSVDIDVFFPGFAAGALRFDAVQLIDDRNEGASTGQSVGADIDAVGAIASTLPNATASPSQTTNPGSPSPSRTPTPTASTSPTPGVSGCPGDCNGDMSVRVNEIVLGVNIALGRGAVENCIVFDTNGDQAVSVDELIAALNAALHGCRV